MTNTDFHIVYFYVLEWTCFYYFFSNRILYSLFIKHNFTPKELEGIQHNTIQISYNENYGTLDMTTANRHFNNSPYALVYTN